VAKFQTEQTEQNDGAYQEERVVTWHSCSLI
jgi:hypothetical protein